MFIIKIILALAFTLLTTYHIASFLHSIAQFLNIIRPGEQTVDFPVNKMILAIILTLTCVFTWKIIF